MQHAETSASPSHVSLGTRVPPSLPLTPRLMGLSIHLPLSRSPRNKGCVGDRSREPAEEEAPKMSLSGRPIPRTGGGGGPFVQLSGRLIPRTGGGGGPCVNLAGDRSQEPAEVEAPVCSWRATDPKNRRRRRPLCYSWWATDPKNRRRRRPQCSERPYSGLFAAFEQHVFCLP